MGPNKMDKNNNKTKITKANFVGKIFGHGEKISIIRNIKNMIMAIIIYIIQRFINHFFYDIIWMKCLDHQVLFIFLILSKKKTCSGIKKKHNKRT